MKRIGYGIAGLVLVAVLTATGCGKRSDATNEAREKALRAHHEQCLEMFIKTEANGFRRMLTFHHAAPDYPRSLLLADADPTQSTGAWVMDRIQLVGLLKSEHPRAYTEAARMRPGGATRDLDGVESYALSRLLDGQEVHITDTAGEVRMLGAIRMRQDCKSCHDKAVGTLLGAFSYSFKRVAQ